MNYLSGLALNRDPPDLCLLSSWDYRREPLAPGYTVHTEKTTSLCRITRSRVWRKRFVRDKFANRSSLDYDRFFSVVRRTHI
jgi:hypothetical protein